MTISPAVYIDTRNQVTNYGNGYIYTSFYIHVGYKNLYKPSKHRFTQS